MKLNFILKEIEQIALKSKHQQKVKLIAVSKQKSISEILELYSKGQRDFGENYVDELIEKSGQLPKDINWHFIGHLQSNKIKLLSKVVNLKMIHSIDSIKQCSILNKEMQSLDKKLEVLVQVKTSNEENKSGLDSQNVESVVEFVVKQCQFLLFRGFMTIGEPGDTSQFEKLRKLKEHFQLLFPSFELELSMGMSADFKEAIIEGATFVRIGSLLFGEREYKDKEILGKK